MKRNEKKFGTSAGPKDEKGRDSVSQEEATPNKAGTVVGCVSTDKTVVVTEEFDLLFGAKAQARPKKEPKTAAPKPETEEEDDFMDETYGEV